MALEPPIRWAESLGFPQAVAATSGKATQPPADTDTPVDLALRGACRLAFTAARKVGSDVALAALPPGVRGRCSDADGKPDAEFTKLSDELQQIEPTF